MAAAAHHGLTTSTMTPARQPKIRIMHIIAPEIINTDVASFRDLVQRLTGKPTTTTTTTAAGASSTNTSSSPPPPLEEDSKESVMTIKRKSPPPPPEAAPSDLPVQQDDEPSSKKRKIKCEVKVEEEEEDGGFFGDYAGLDCNDLWMDLNPGGSFLSFLEEELQAAADHDFLQLPFGPAAARMDLVGEMYAS